MNIFRKYSVDKFWNRLKHWIYHIPLSRKLLLVILCLLTFGKLVEENILFKRFDQRHANKIQKIFLQKENQLENYVERIKQGLDNKHFAPFYNIYSKSLDEHGFRFFIYQDDCLQYWSSQKIPVPQVFTSSSFDKSYFSTTNGRYAAFVYPYKNYKIVGLILLKSVYQYENKYLQKSFHPDFGLPAQVKIFPELRQGYYPICDHNGNFVWALIFDDSCSYRYQTVVPSLTYLAAIIVFFFLISAVLRRQRNDTRKNILLPVWIVVLVLLRWIMQTWRIPQTIYDLAVFDPIYFASDWFPSLGDLCLWCIFVGFFIFEFYRYAHLPAFRNHRWKFFSYVTLQMSAVIICSFVVGVLIKTLVINSSEMFETPSRTLLLNRYTLLGYFIILQSLFSLGVLLDKFLILCDNKLHLNQLFILFAIALSVVIIGWLVAGLYVDIFTIVLISIMVLIMGYIRLKKRTAYRYGHIILLVFVSFVYVAIEVYQFSSIKYEDQKKVIVTNKASPHDLTAEFLLRNVSERIITDTILTDIMYDKQQDEVLEYIKRNYFYGSYWNTYENYLCVVCNEFDSLATPNGKEPNCIDFFRQTIDEKGSQLSQSQFYYITRQQTDLLSSYLGWFRKERGEEKPLHLFIEVWTKGASDDIGYPELLLDSQTSKENNLNGYSFAKYHNNRRISQSGAFNYNLSGDIFQPTQPSQQMDYHTIVSDGMEHLVYFPDPSNMIVLSSHNPNLMDLVINFSYSFILAFLLVSTIFLFLIPARTIFQWNLRKKIQSSMIITIIVSFGVIGVYTFSHINKQYMNKHHDAINGKMQSVYKELQNALHLQNNQTQWKSDTDDLTEWLLLFRGMFSTDINLYDVDGSLLATSVPDVFDRGLISRQINPDAFIKLIYGQKASIVEYESIGSLKYISAYEPFMDNNNNVVAFLNLPYFTQQDELKEEISGLVVAIINFYMIIIFITVIISVIIGNQITYPLNLLQEKFKNIKLGEKNEPIRYVKNDEIGRLVKEYNRAIDELAISANRLARSERESAWRDMAKQIAHEINNPLTPMKLSIQHLKRAWDNKSDRFSEYIEKISHSLIEQIDTLSAIATEFSNFAKMPTVNNQLMDILASINDVVALFATGDNKRAFHTNFHGLSTAMVFADKEQLSRVFINLFKNGLQAIPKDRKPQILIDVLQLNRMIWIRIKDNGMGIPEDMQEKIFQPNFTTKSSGMGVGLNIVRSIIESTGGTISFNTKPHEGTAFILSLPSKNEDNIKNIN